MKLKTIKGSWVALITPFKADNSIDFNSFKRLIDFHLEAKTDGLLICGTTAESPTITHSEREQLMKAALELTKGKLPIMLGTGSNNTAVASELTAEAQDLGADAVLVVAPYYNKPPQHALIKHYTEVAASTKLPVVLYNVPGRTGCCLQAETVLELAKVKNIVAVKEASGNLNLAMNIISHAPRGFNLLSGEDALNLPIMAAGGAGTISVTANVCPALMKQFNDFALKGSFDEARKLHYKLLELHHALFAETNPLPVKAALKCLKLIAGDTARAPLYKPSKAVAELIKNVVKKL